MTASPPINDDIAGVPLEFYSPPSDSQILGGRALAIVLVIVLVGMVVLAVLAGVALSEQARQIGMLTRTDSVIFHNQWRSKLAAINRLAAAACQTLDEPILHKETFIADLESLRHLVETTEQPQAVQTLPAPINDLDDLRVMLAEWIARATNAHSPAMLRQIAQEVITDINKLYAKGGRLQQVISTHAAVRSRQRDNLLNSMKQLQWTLGGLTAGSIFLTFWLIVLIRQVRHFHRCHAKAHAELESIVARRTQQLVWLANTDPLTGLKNRRAFMEAAQAQILQSERYSYPLVALALDIDHFKSINDRYGHQVGDEALKQIAKSITQIVRVTDIVGRLGGEEFAVIMTHTDLESARISAERLRQTIASIEITLSTAETLRSTISIGIVLYQHGMTLDTLLLHADMALYRAKNAGRNRVEIYETSGASS